MLISSVISPQVSALETHAVVANLLRLFGRNHSLPARGIQEHLATVSPFRDVNEIGCRAAKRLCNSHRQSHADGEFRDAKVRELIRCAVQTFGHLLPRGSACRTIGVQRFVELAQVPAQPMCLVRLRKCYATSTGFGLGDKSLGRNAQPAQQEQCMLATGVTTLAYPPERCRADRVIGPLLIQDA